MDILDYILMEIPQILYYNERIKLAKSKAEAEEAARMADISETEMLEWCTLENFLGAKSFYEEKLEKGEERDLYGVATKDALDYAEKLIAMKKERER